MKQVTYCSLLFLYRLALLQQWREKHGPNATYRNLAKSFYDAGKPGLVETVCVVMTCDYPTVSTPQQAPISLSRAIPNATTATSSTRISSLACKCVLLCFVIITVVLSVILALYIFVADNSQHFASESLSSASTGKGDIECTGVKRFCCGDKTSEFAQNNLPHLPGPFIGRDKEVGNITHLLRFAEHSHTKMVHIYGLPAVGKSTLAVHVGYEMARRGVAVRYINVDETHIFKGHEHTVTENHDQRTSNALTKRVSDIELSWYSHTDQKYVSTSPEGLIQWAKGLSNDTVLILDNCDPVFENKDTQKDLVKMISNLNKASPLLHTVTTSRLKISLLDGFKLYKLKPLDNESVIELLQSVSDVMTLNNSRTVSELVGGIPLALKIVGNLVNEMQAPDLIIRELKRNLIDTLTPEDVGPETEKMRPVLEISYKYLDTSTQECALYLSHFPGSFSHEAALYIITINKPARCLKSLVDRSLLDQYSYADQHRYKFHMLIREYMIGVEFQHPITSTTLRFNYRFVSYYTQVLSNFVNIYNERPHDEENIGRFEYESHNFEYLLGKVYYFQPWPFMSFVNMSRSLTSSLMLETFTISELLPVGQKILVMFEYGMDNISTQIGASETLNIYRNLTLVLRLWIHSFPAKNWSTLCKETFLQQGFTSRYEIIHKQVVETNFSAHHYYRDFKFLYSSSSFCEYYADYIAVEDAILMLLLPCCLVSVWLMLLILIAYNSFLCTCISLLVGIPIISLYFSHIPNRVFGIIFYVALCVGLRPIDFLLLQTTRYKNLIPMLSILYCIILCTFLFHALKEDIVMTTFVCTCVIICDIANLFITKFNVLHIFILIIVARVYINEVDIVDYIIYSVFSLLYPYHLYFIDFLKNFLLQLKMCYFIWSLLARL